MLVVSVVVATLRDQVRVEAYSEGPGRGKVFLLRELRGLRLRE